MQKAIDIVFSIVFVFIAPVVAGAALIRFPSGDSLTKIASLGLLAVAILVFGIACMGLSRMDIFFRSKRY